VIDEPAIREWTAANKRARDDYRVQPFERVDDNVAAGVHKPPSTMAARYQAQYRERKAAKS